MTDSEFRIWLAKQEFHTRLTDYTTYDNYYYGMFSKITLPKHIKDAMGTDVAVHANLCKSIIDVKVQYVCGAPVGITVESDIEDDARSKDAEQLLYKVYKNNGLIYRNMLKTVRMMSKKGDVFLKVTIDETPPKKLSEKILTRLLFWRSWKDNFANRVKIRILDPINVFPKYSDDNYEELELCAIKYFNYDAVGNKQWFAQVWYPDKVETWELRLEIVEATNTNNPVTTSPQWRRMSEPVDNKYGFIPIVPIANTIDEREFGVSDLHCISEIQDLYNKTLTDMMISMDYQAFQRIFIFGAMTKTGVNWDISPGVVSEIPNADARLQVVEGANISPFLDVLADLKATACEVSQTPQIALGNIQGGIPSGYALRIHYQPLENKCNETRILLQDAFDELNKMIFMIYAQSDGGFDYTDLSTKLQFIGGLPIDKDTIAARHQIQIASGTISKETAMQEEGIEDIPAELQKIKAEEFDIYGNRPAVESQMMGEQQPLTI